MITIETFIFTLTRPARSGGGDRYETTIEGVKDPWVIYVPQIISRVENIVPQILKLEVDFIEAKGVSNLARHKKK